MMFPHHYHVRSLFALAAVLAALMIANAKAQVGYREGEYRVTAMPAELAQDAEAVARLDALTFTVENPGKATQIVRQVYTILSPGGRDYGKIYIGYDKFRELTSLRGWLIDAEGRKIRDLKKNDIKDESAISGYSLYEDSRVRSAELYYDAYPYTVMFEYEMVFHGLLFWPSWYPYLYRAPVERSRFEIDVPAGMPIRYHLRGVQQEPQIQAAGNRNVLRWHAQNLPKWEPEPSAPNWSPRILAAPTAFEIAGYAGVMSSWTSFGKWYYQLYSERMALPPTANAEVQRLSSAAATPRDRVRVLYEYLQAKTRYVSVQLGIGGWQPFEPAYVFERGYGDCKALSNFMVAMLRAAQVEAHPVLILSGEEQPDVPADFPNGRFNHVIVCVPLEQDTVWLECTSQTAPFGHIGAGNEDRNVLLVTPEGGKLVRTPQSKSINNQRIRHATVKLSENGDASAEIRTRYTGNAQDHVRYALARQSPREREEWLRKEIEGPTFQLTRVDFSEVDGKQHEINLPLAVTLPRLAARSGARLFLRPNLMSRRKYVPPPVAQRTQPVDFAYAYLNTDSIHYELPAGFVLEAVPDSVKLETAFGSYHASATLQSGKLEYVRRLEIRRRLLPLEEYDAYRKFLSDIVKADQAQIVLVKKI
ncbi:transglutaminase-like domain-containing protein [bacterium]|nr:transglutaminase-like domain-containing protein [bacterium]